METTPATIQLHVDGTQVEVPDDGASLLEVLRDRLRLTSPKDGCSPQGQCGCCTVLVDGQPRVACVTPARRVAGRTITTLDGLPDDVRRTWLDAFTATGASQCGFCTPGIIVRLESLREKGTLADEDSVETALLAHLCRCTGWRTILEAAAAVAAGEHPVAPSAPRDLDAAARRATIEGHAPQRVGPDVAAGAGGFADDTAPADALVAIPADAAASAWVVQPTLTAARRAAGKVQGRRTTIDPTYPIDVPDGQWEVTLRTTWVEPAYLETDASWCPATDGAQAATPLANGGAFGGKVDSPCSPAACRLAADHGRAVRTLLSREDTVRLGPKRPPMAAGISPTGTGVIRVARTPGIAEAITSFAPGFEVEEVDVAGPPTSAAVRAAGWAEAAVLLAALRGDAAVLSPSGAFAQAAFDSEGVLHVQVECGDPLDEVVLRSYCIGAAHMGMGWVLSEAIAVDEAGEVHDLTIRSFGILRARDMPPVEVVIRPGAGAPVNGSDAVFAAVAAATWLREGDVREGLLPTEWPTRRSTRP